MRVSVVVPTLNEEKMLRTMLKSIRGQKTGHQIEIIVVDSNSTDKTLEIAKEYADKILFAPPGIIAVARQEGSKAATGEIIVSTCADSFYEPNWLEELVSPIVSGKSVATAGKLLPLDGNFSENFFSECFMYPFARVSMLLGMPFIGGESMAFTKKAFDAVGGYRTDLVTGEDTNLMKRLKTQGAISFCPKAIVRLSTRRFRQWGYAKYIWYHSTNFLRMHFHDKSHDGYEPIR